MFRSGYTKRRQIIAMNLLSTNIYLNCIRLFDYYDGIFHYICIAFSTGDYRNINNQLHLLVYSGGWFFYGIQWSGHRYIQDGYPGKTTPRCGYSMLFGCSFFWFRVSESGHRYAHKTPFFSTCQDKNSTLENSHNSMQCPKPDNMRPKKAILPFFWESLERNNGLTLGRLVSIVQVNAGLCYLGFLREERAVLKQKLNF